MSNCGTPDGTAPASQLLLQVFSHSAVQGAPYGVIAQGCAIPIGRWFQVEVFFRPTPDVNGRLTVWQDGTQILDWEQANAPTTAVEWSVGSTGLNVTPPMVEVWVDDVAISRRRLGPDFPPFWRP